MSAWNLRAAVSSNFTARDQLIRDAKKEARHSIEYSERKVQGSPVPLFRGEKRKHKYKAIFDETEERKRQGNMGYVHHLCSLRS